jgi:outer membrane murein-binding lipoprotein Lpp
MQIQNDIIHIAKIEKGVIGMEEKILQAIEGLKNSFNQKFDNLSSQVDNLSSQVDILSSQVQENTQILKALEHLAQVNKAEHDKMSFDIAEISGEIKTIRKDLSTVELITANNWGDIAKLKSVK